MHMKFFTIPAFGGRAAAEEFEQFLAAHRIIAVDREFVQDGRGSAWALCVRYDGPGEYRVRSAHPTFVTYIENRIVESDASLKGDAPVIRIIDSRSQSPQARIDVRRHGLLPSVGCALRTRSV